MMYVIKIFSGNVLLCNTKVMIMEAIHFERKEKKAGSIIREAEQANIYLHNGSSAKTSYIKKFLQFASDQQPNYFGWVSVSLLSQACFFAPITVLCILFNGNLLGLWIPCIFTFVIIEIINLTAMPTKITVPVFFAGAVIDIIIIALSFLL